MTTPPNDPHRFGAYACPNCGTVNQGSPDRCRRCGTKLRLPESSIGPGTIIDGKYEVLGLLGVGGMGEVFKVRHMHLETIRCIKVMKRELMEDAAYSRRFVREAKVATRVHHQNVAIVHDFSTLEDGTYYMVHEYIDGITVRQWLARNGRLPLGLAITAAVQVLSGLQHCHSRGLLHRDISADNIMLTVDDEERPAAKIIDLGIAKVTEASEVTQKTMAGLFVGNPKYSSPEQLGQLREGEELDARTDLYSLGVALYEMVMGVPPFYSRTPQGYLLQHVTAPVTPFHEVDPSIVFPEGFEDVVRHALEKDRNNRYESAREFSRALRPFLKEFEGQEDQWARLLLRELPSRQAALRTRGGSIRFDADATTRLPEAPADRQSADEAQWKEVERAENLKLVREYLAGFPDGSHADEARRRIDLFVRIEKLDEQEQLEALKQLEDSVRDIPLLESRLRTAIDRLSQDKGGFVLKKTVALATSDAEDEEAWRSADQSEELASLKRYLAEFPSGRHVDEARRRIDLAARIDELEKQEEINSLRVLAGSVREIPLLAGRVRAAVERLEQRQSEAPIRKTMAVESLDVLDHGRWETLSASGEPESLREYLGEYPSGLHAAEAKRRLDLIAEISDLESRDALDGLRALETSVGDAPPIASRLHESIARIEEKERLAEQQDWDRAAEAGTAEAWDAFIAAHGSSSRIDEANEAKEEVIAFEQARREGTAAAWTAFLSRWPQSRRADEARAQLDEAGRRAEVEAWEAALAASSAAGWQAFVDTHPGSDRVDEAKQRLDEAREFESAASRGDRSTLERYLEKYPDGVHAPQAQIKISELRAAEAEEAFQSAVASDSPAAMQAFLLAHPESQHVEEVREMLASRLKPRTGATLSDDSGPIFAWEEGSTDEEKALELAIADGSSRAFRRFLRRFPDATEKTRVQEFFEEALAWERTRSRAEVEQFLRLYPDGLHSASARHRLTDLTEDDDFVRATRQGTVEALSSFLDEHPAGEHASEASEQLAALNAKEDEQAAYASLRDDIRNFEESHDLASLKNLVGNLRYDHPLYPDATDALDRLQSAERSRKEAAAWSEAERVGTKDAWKVFLNVYPSSERAALAKKHLDEENEWEELRKIPVRAGFEKFVKRWPDGRHRLDAERELERLKAEERPAKDAAIPRTEFQGKAVPPRTVVMEPAGEREIRRPPILTTPEPPSRSRLGIVVAVVVAVAAVAALAVYLLRGPSEPPSPQPLANGTLTIDAQPWAEIESIRNSDGKEMLEKGTRFTPSVFVLPQGTYTITLANPNAPDALKTRVVAIDANANVSIQEKLDTIDASRYFALEGWQ